jgi:hypothetical protein
LFVAVWNVNLHFLMFSAGQNVFIYVWKACTEHCCGLVVFHLLIQQVMDSNFWPPKG